MAYVLKTEIVTENGVEMKKTYYTSDGENIIGISTENIQKDVPKEPEPTQLDKLEENQLALMEAVADQYEEQIENRINDMEVQASIYEAVLALGGE